MCQKRVYRFCDIYVPKVRKSLSRHTCQSAKTSLTKVQDMDVATILQIIKYLSEKFPDCLQTFQTVWRVSRQSKHFLHCPETFHTVKKLSGNFLDQLETFQTDWKLSRLYGNFPDRLETLQSVRKLSRLSGNF